MELFHKVSVPLIGGNYQVQGHCFAHVHNSEGTQFVKLSNVFHSKKEVLAIREVSKSDAEWQSQLGSERYDVLRRQGTEAPFSGQYVHPAADGSYHCAACDAVLFDAHAQFDSGTGWPSFTEPAIAESVELRADRGIGMRRTEVVCRRCGGHLGHVFNDGPGPSGQRYCINSAALELRPQTP